MSENNRASEQTYLGVDRFKLVLSQVLRLMCEGLLASFSLREALKINSEGLIKLVLTNGQSF